jgi:hypothetical protein
MFAMIQRFRSTAIAALAGFATLAAAHGAEVTVQNDNLNPGDQGAIQVGFVAQERAAVWLRSPCNGNIVAVQIFWRSFFGTGEPTLEDNITISLPGTFPVPGAPLAFLEGPVMNDGVVNEFRYLDEDQVIPISVPISNGDEFVVSFTFYETPGLFDPSLVTDVNGCQAGKNAIFTQPGLTWVNGCDLGISGDFVIRAVIDCETPSGACCTVGNCTPNVLQTNCQAQGQVFHEGLTCAQVVCPPPTGACCIGGSCLPNVTQATCQSAPGGVYAGNGSTCPNACVTGACCLTDGTCLTRIQTQCNGPGMTFNGPGTTCTPNPCPQPTGACCFMGICFPDQTSAACLSLDPPGTWQGAGSVCTPDPCNCAGHDGDVNDDAVADGRDVDLFVQGILGNPTAPQICAGDFNDNSDLDTGDIPGMVNVLLGL